MSIITAERPVEGLYEKGNLSWIRMHSSAANHRARYQFAARIFVKTRATTIGDMGCGIGESTFYLKNLMIAAGLPLHLLLGVDISTDAIGKARQRLLLNASFLSADLSSDQLADTIREAIPDLQTLSGIVFAETLEHISPTSAAPRALTNLTNLLEPNAGRLIVTSPNRLLTSTLRDRPFNPYHTQEYSLEEFEKELRDSGLNIITLYGQRAVPKEFLKILHPLQYIANNVPQIREIAGKVIGMMVIIKQPNAEVLPFNRETHEPQYFAAICKK